MFFTKKPVAVTFDSIIADITAKVQQLRALGQDADLKALNCGVEAERLLAQKVEHEFEMARANHVAANLEAMVSGPKKLP
jgi:hypothetical protein